MPRKPRMYIPGMPCHVIQRGNNREVCFFSDQDYQFYLECLYDASQRYGVLVHAYVLMTNHVHLLITPLEVDSISLMMQSIGRRYVQYANKEYRRTGTLWESRHKSSLVDENNYLLKYMRYIELNPVRASMVDYPGDYRWSSYQSNANNEFNKLISCHGIYLSLGNNSNVRLQAYRSLFEKELKQAEINLIRNSALFSMPTGNGRFKKQIEKAMSRKLGYAKRGRPAI